MKLAANVLVLLLAGCASAPSNPGLSCEAAGPHTFYFPAGTFFDPGYERYGSGDTHGGWESDASTREWFSAHLRAMREPSLSCGQLAASESYRFLWLRTFHEPIAVRVSRTGERHTLDAVILDGAGGYDPGKVARRVQRELTQADWTRVSLALEQMNFQSMPSAEPWDVSEDPATGGLILRTSNDGAQWILERRSGSYHAIDRHGGADGTGEAGRIFLDLSGLGIAEDDIY